MVRISCYYQTFLTALTQPKLNLIISIPILASHTDTIDGRPRKTAGWGDSSSQVTVVPNETMSGEFDMKLIWSLFCKTFRSKDGLIIIPGQRQAHGWSETRFKYAERATDFASLAQKLLRIMYPLQFRNLRPSTVTFKEEITPWRACFPWKLGIFHVLLFSLFYNDKAFFYIHVFLNII